MDIKFDVCLYSENLGALYKDNEIDLDGLEAKVDLNLNEVNGIAVNFEVGGKSYTDHVEIKDKMARTIQIPFKTSVLKAGNNSFELVATMKNGDVKTSRTYSYQIAKSLENPNAVEAETNYPILVELINKVSAITANEGGGGESSGHTHANKEVLDGITASKVNEWNNKSDFSGSYNDLTNKPTIPTVDVTKSYVDNALAKKANTSHTHEEYATKTELNDKADAGHTHSNYATKDELVSKADAGHTHSNYATKSEVANKAETYHIHSEYATHSYVQEEISKVTLGDGISIVALTKEEYEALTVKDTNTLYVIKG